MLLQEIRRVGRDVATPEDYLSRPFGDFVLDEIVGSGATAEVFRCVHVPTGLFYALRLGIEEDRLWDGPPILPPLNGVTERKTAEISWAVGVTATRGADSVFVQAFRIVDARYVVPLSARVRLNSAWSIERARALPPPPGEFTGMLSLYDDALGLMYADAALGNDDLDVWLARWKWLSGGTYLMAKLDPVIEDGALLPLGAGVAERDALRTKLSTGIEGHVELAENVLVKLCAALARDELDRDAFKATLLDPYFRLNIHRIEVTQLLRLHERFAQAEELHYASESLDSAQKWIGLTLGLLSEPFADLLSDPAAFEVRETDKPVVEDDWLIVQEFALTRPSLFEAVDTLVTRVAR